MNITSAKYGFENECIIAIIDGVTLIVPKNLGNRHYAEIMRLVGAGELTIEPADQPE